MNISIDTLFLIMFGLICISFLASIIVIRDTAKIPDISSRLIRMEHVLNQLFMHTQLRELSQPMDSQPPGRIMFKSPDGKHSARTPEELIQKIMDDPEYNIHPKNQDGLRKFFEELMREDEDDDFHEGF